jgi:hypothetical protein
MQPKHWAESLSPQMAEPPMANALSEILLILALAAIVTAIVIAGASVIS